MKKWISTFALMFFFVLGTMACPLCQGGQGVQKKTIDAYKKVTLFLALSPMIAGAGIYFWVKKSSRKPQQP